MANRASFSRPQQGLPEMNTRDLAGARMFSMGQRAIQESNLKDMKMKPRGPMFDNNKMAKVPTLSPGAVQPEFYTPLESSMVASRSQNDYDISEQQGLADMREEDPLDLHFEAIWNYYSTYGDLDGVKKRFGEVFLDDRFWDWMERKKMRETSLDFEMFKLNMVDLSNPALRDYWQAKFPELVQKKLLYYKNRSRVRARLEEIQARGFSGQEDLLFLYLFNMKIFETSTPETINDYFINPDSASMIWRDASGKAPNFNKGASTFSWASSVGVKPDMPFLPQRGNQY